VPVKRVIVTASSHTHTHTSAVPPTPTPPTPHPPPFSCPPLRTAAGGRRHAPASPPLHGRCPTAPAGRSAACPATGTCSSGARAAWGGVGTRPDPCTGTAWARHPARAPAPRSSPASTRTIRSAAPAAGTLPCAQRRGQRARRPHLCEMVFLTPLSICAYVCSKPSGRNTGSQPNWFSPWAATMRPCVWPTNVMGSTSGAAGWQEGRCGGEGGGSGRAYWILACRGAAGEPQCRRARRAGAAAGGPIRPREGAGRAPRSSRAAHMACRRRCTGRRRSCPRSQLRAPAASGCQARPCRTEQQPRRARARPWHAASGGQACWQKLNGGLPEQGQGRGARAARRLPCAPHPASC
jgi:hypothetical protein